MDSLGKWTHYGFSGLNQRDKYMYGHKRREFLSNEGKGVSSNSRLERYILVVSRKYMLDLASILCFHFIVFTRLFPFSLSLCRIGTVVVLDFFPIISALCLFSNSVEQEYMDILCGRIL